LYVEDKHKLPVNAPGAYQDFSDGKFVVRTQGMFNAVCADMVLEQIINGRKKCMWNYW
jgi:hypothetical protein